MNKLIFVNIGMMMFRGGGENFDINMSKALKDLGYEVEIYSLKPLLKSSTYDKVAEHFDKETFIKSPWLYPLTQFFHKNKYLKKLRGIRGIPRILGQIIFEFRVFLNLKSREDDFVVHTCELPLLTYLVSKFTDKKAYMRMPGPLNNFYDIFLAKGCTGIIANGNAYEQIKKRDIVNDKLHFINIGVYEFDKTKLIDKKVFRKSIGIESDEFVIIFVGRLIDIKNIPMLLKGFSLFLGQEKNSKLIIIGDGNKKDDLKELVSSLNIKHNVLFKGNLEKDELGNYYNIADVCALTSHYDNFPNVLIEAMSFGVPCIGTNVGGIPSIIEDGVNGYIVNSNDEKMLASKFSKSKNKIFDREIIKERINYEYSWRKSAENFKLKL
ncbi:glycosyltransferase family 4 protein [Aliarcobacter butzleri]